MKSVSFLLKCFTSAHCNKVSNFCMGMNTHVCAHVYVSVYMYMLCAPRVDNKKRASNQCIVAVATARSSSKSHTVLSLCTPIV